MPGDAGSAQPGLLGDGTHARAVKACLRKALQSGLQDPAPRIGLQEAGIVGRSISGDFFEQGPPAPEVAVEGSPGDPGCCRDLGNPGCTGSQLTAKSLGCLADPLGGVQLDTRGLRHNTIHSVLLSEQTAPPRECDNEGTRLPAGAPNGAGKPTTERWSVFRFYGPGLISII